MQQDIMPFAYDDNLIRVIQDENKDPLFVAKDVCAVLEHSNSRMALQALDEDEKGVRKVYTPGGTQEISVITESGLYTLIIRSNKPQAKPFRRWVTHEVLPSIRKTGAYAAKPKEEIWEPTDRLLKTFSKQLDLAKKAGLGKRDAILQASERTEEITGISVVREYNPALLNTTGDSATSVEDFISTTFEPDPGGNVRTKDLYAVRYKHWCEDMDIRPKQQKEFTDTLRRMGYRKKRARIDGQHFYRWFGLKEK